MKKSFRIAMGNKLKSVTTKATFATTAPLFYLLILLTVFAFTGCKKDDAAGSTTKVESQSAEKEPLTFYEGLAPQTMFELQQARAATAKYQNIQNAFADGFETTPVVVLPNMGYHFRKLSNIDGTFDIKNPEILVYNKDDKGQFVLVAVEYAVPFTFSANAPEGFTGSDDVWDHTTAFGLWTLHAWVWKNNPDGVFAPMNPTVQVQ